MTTEGQAHPIHAIDDLTHQRIRLATLALLSHVDALEFTRIRDEIGTTDGNLSRHVKALEEGGLVTVSKVQNRTWIGLTADGSSALETQVRALRTMLEHIETD